MPWGRRPVRILGGRLAAVATIGADPAEQDLDQRNQQLNGRAQRHRQGRVVLELLPDVCQDVIDIPVIDLHEPEPGRLVRPLSHDFSRPDFSS